MSLPTKKISQYYMIPPVSDLATLGLVSTSEKVNGVIGEVVNDGFFALENPSSITPDGIDTVAGLNGGVWKRKSAPLLKTVPIILTTNVTIASADIPLRDSRIFINDSLSIVTITISGGVTFKNPTVLNGSDTTIGLNPKEAFCLTLLPDSTILVT